MPVPDYDQLYYLSGGYRRGAIVLHAPGLDAYALKAGEVVPPGPVVCEHVQSKQARDFVSVGTVFAISPKTQAVLRDAGATGWHTIPIAPPAEFADLLAGYGLLVATGRCGAHDKSRSVPTMSAPEEGVRSMPVFRGMYFEEDRWDGSDVFMPHPSGFQLVTERVRQAVVRARLTNVDFERLTEFELPDYDRAERI